MAPVESTPTLPTDAMFRLFLCYKFGKGVTPNKDEAEKWRTKAKELGVTEYIDYYYR